MSIHPHNLPDLERFGEYYSPPMLMLGATGSTIPECPMAQDYFAKWVGGDYHDLDLDGGDLALDLNNDLASLSASYQTVFNLGTIEHVWDTNHAWANALRAVKIGGHFLTHSPVSGYRNHGLHITTAPAIRAFVSKNGFTILDDWITRRVTPSGTEVGELLWLAAVKDRHIEDLTDFAPAWQVYEAGEKKQVR